MPAGLLLETNLGWSDGYSELRIPAIASHSKYENGWQCTTEPRYADATKNQGTVKVKEIVELGGSREHQVQGLAEIRATAQEIEAAFFAICQDYGTGNITDKDQYDKEYNNLTEIRDLYLRGNIPGGSTRPYLLPI